MVESVKLKTATQQIDRTNGCRAAVWHFGPGTPRATSMQLLGTVVPQCSAPILRLASGLYRCSNKNGIGLGFKPLHRKLCMYRFTIQNNIHIHIHTYTYSYTYIFICMHARMHACMHAYIQTYIIYPTV